MPADNHLNRVFAQVHARCLAEYGPIAGILAPPLDFPNFPARALAEREIITLAIDGLLNAGYAISVNDGEETTVKRSTDRQEIANALWTTDMDRLDVYDTAIEASVNNGMPRIGWVLFIYGNDGSDVISDYTVNLEAALAQANARANELMS